MTIQKKAPILLWLYLVAGTLDIVAAIVMNWQHPAAAIFRYIASGWVGSVAFKGGTGMAALGLLSHYLIASIFCCIFFYLYPGFRRIIGNKVMMAIVIGIIIWATMKFIVLPISNVPKHAGPEPISGMLIDAGVLCLTLGAPIVMFAGRYYKRLH